MKSIKKESRRQFLKNKLLKGLYLSFIVPFSGIANEAFESSQNSIDLFAKSNNDVDWQKVKNQFTLDAKCKHFNTASIGASPQIVQETTISMIRHINQFAKENHSIVEQTREKLADLVQANSSQIAITRNTTEGINIIARSLKLSPGDEVIITSEEHVGGITPWLTLQNEIGINVISVDILGQEFDAVKLIHAAFSARTKVVSVSHLTYTTGAVLPIKEIVNLCKTHQIYSVIDGAQALGQIPLNLRDLQPDFYSSSCCKWLFGPKGTGMLYLNKSFLENSPPLFAGAYTDCQYDAKKGEYKYIEHARRYEYATINAPIIAGLGAAINFITQIGISQIAIRSRQLASRFRDGITSHEKIKILTPASYEECASIVTFTIRLKDSELIKLYLIKHFSIFLRSIFENDMNAIRASFAIYNNEEEVDQLIKSIRYLADASE